LLGSDGIFVVDVDPKVMRFHEINRSLLLQAKNIEDYRRLRFNTSLWPDRLAARWWKKNVVDSWEFKALHSDPNSQNGDAHFTRFKSANYIYDEVLFNRIKTLAVQGKIFFELADIKKSSARIIAAIKALGLHIGIFSISNSYETLSYAHYPGVSSILKWVKDFYQAGLFNKNSAVVSTHYIDHRFKYGALNAIASAQAKLDDFGWALWAHEYWPTISDCSRLAEGL
jgi:hypothetical protein